MRHVVVRLVRDLVRLVSLVRDEICLLDQIVGFDGNVGVGVGFRVGEDVRIGQGVDSQLVLHQLVVQGDVVPQLVIGFPGQIVHRAGRPDARLADRRRSGLSGLARVRAGVAVTARPVGRPARR